jgi:hypothetical protein
MATCPSVAVVPAGLVRQLDELRADYPPDDEWSCDFDAGHAGEEHWTIAVYGGADGVSEDLWLRWRTGGETVLVEHPGCEAFAPSGDEQGPYCFWVAGHPGLHPTGDERW